MCRIKGFSLIEVILTLAVVAVVGSMTLNFSAAFIQDNRLSVANNDLVSSINLARSTAVSRSSKASICASSDGATCTGTAWELGWIVFTDGDAAGVVDGSDEIIQASTNAGIDVSITSPSSYIQFKPQGAVASICVNCFDKIINQSLGNIFIAAIKNLSPISNAVASGSSGDSGGSGETVKNCNAPESEVTSDSGSSGKSGTSDSSSASLNIQHFARSAVKVLKQISPISTAHASGTSGASTSAAIVTATCDDGDGTPQADLDDSSFLICDSSRSSEKGNLISVTAVGRVSRNIVACN